MAVDGGPRRRGAGLCGPERQGAGRYRRARSVDAGRAGTVPGHGPDPPRAVGRRDPRRPGRCRRGGRRSAGAGRRRPAYSGRRTVRPTAKEHHGTRDPLRQLHPSRWPGGHRPGPVGHGAGRRGRRVRDVHADGPLLPDGGVRRPPGADARGLHLARLPGRPHRADAARPDGHRGHLPPPRDCWPRSSPPSTWCRAAGPSSASAPRGTSGSTSATACRSLRSPSASNDSRRPSRSASRCGATTTGPTRAPTTVWPRRSARPRPVSDPRPRILIGGSGERKTLRLVARYADACNLFATEPAEVAHKLEVLERHCADEDRDPAEIQRTILAMVDPLTDVDGFLGPPWRPTPPRRRAGRGHAAGGGPGGWAGPAGRARSIPRLADLGR